MLHFIGLLGSFSSLFTFLQPVLLSGSLVLWLPAEFSQWEALVRDQADGSRTGQSMYALSPAPPGHTGLACPLDKDHSFYQSVLSMQLSYQGLAFLHPFRFRGGNGFTYLRVMKYPLFISLNAAHIFIHSHFLKLFSNYPVSTCHLFLISPGWIKGHHGPGVQSRWVN